MMGKPMLEFQVDALRKAGVGHVVMVVGHKRDLIQSYFGNDVSYATQELQHGTAHAVQCAQGHLDKSIRDTFVFVGDTPLLRPDTVTLLHESHLTTGAACSFLSADFPVDFPYPRILRNSDGTFEQVKESSQCTKNELAVREYLTGHYLFDLEILFEHVFSIRPKRSYQLADILSFISSAGEKINVVKTPFWQELTNVKTDNDLQLAQNYWYDAIRKKPS